MFKNSPGGSDSKKSTCNAGDARDVVSIPGSGRSPGGGNGNPLRCSCLENPRDGGAWWAAVYGVAQSWTRLKRLSSSSSWVQHFPTPWTVALQAPLSMEYSSQEYWSELPFPPPGDLPDPEIKPVSPALAGRFFTTAPSGKLIISLRNIKMC